MDDATLNSFPATLTVDVDGKATPLRDVPFVKDAPDIHTLIKNGYEAHKEVGARIPLKLDGKPESLEAWRKEHMPRLYKAGVLTAPPGTPEEYGIKKPDGDHPGLIWDEEKGKDFAKLLHKHGASKELAADLLKFNQERMAETAAVYKGTIDEGMAELKKTFGTEFDKLYESAGRMASQIFTEDEMKFMEAAGVANHPTWLSVLMKIAPHLESDSSILAGLPVSGGTGMSADSVRTELSDIMFNTANARHAAYRRNDPAVMEYIKELYEKAYPEAAGKQVEVT